VRGQFQPRVSDLHLCFTRASTPIIFSCLLGTQPTFKDGSLQQVDVDWNSQYRCNGHSAHDHDHNFKAANWKQVSTTNCSDLYQLRRR
jgi:hypothetical protein